MIKVFILVAAYEDIRDGKLSLTETFTLTDKKRCCWIRRPSRNAQGYDGHGKKSPG
mgnify:CR=1 FL=1